MPPARFTVLPPWPTWSFWGSSRPIPWPASGRCAGGVRPTISGSPPRCWSRRWPAGGAGKGSGPVLRPPPERRRMPLAVCSRALRPRATPPSWRPWGSPPISSGRWRCWLNFSWTPARHAAPGFSAVAALGRPGGISARCALFSGVVVTSLAARAVSGPNRRGIRAISAMLFGAPAEVKLRCAEALDRLRREARRIRDRFRRIGREWSGPKSPPYRRWSPCPR